MENQQPGLRSADESPPSIVYEQVEGNNRLVRYRAIHRHNHNNQPVTIREWAEAMSTNSRQNCLEFNSVIQNSPFEALFFETKGTTDKASYQEAFEFVLVDAPLLDQFVKEGGSDPHTFSEHFDRSGDSTVVAFDNIGGDARLIAPLPPEQLKNGSNNNHQRLPLPLHSYGHLASFCREAPVEQVEQTWQQVASEYLMRLNVRKGKSVWLSTSGLGVAWLHFRLDSKPKYYTYPPFEMMTGIDNNQNETKQDIRARLASKLG